MGCTFEFKSHKLASPMGPMLGNNTELFLDSWPKIQLLFSENDSNFGLQGLQFYFFKGVSILKLPSFIGCVRPAVHGVSIIHHGNQVSESVKWIKWPPAISLQKLSLAGHRHFPVECMVFSGCCCCCCCCCFNGDRSTKTYQYGTVYKQNDDHPRNG